MFSSSLRYISLIILNIISKMHFQFRLLRLLYDETIHWMIHSIWVWWPHKKLGSKEWKLDFLSKSVMMRMMEMIKRPCYYYYVRCILVAFDANFQLCFFIFLWKLIYFCRNGNRWWWGVIKSNDVLNDVILTPLSYGHLLTW